MIKVYNSYQDLQSASTGAFPKAIASGTPSELGKAAEASLKKNGMVFTSKPLTVNDRPSSDINHKNVSTENFMPGEINQFNAVLDSFSDDLNASIIGPMQAYLPAASPQDAAVLGTALKKLKAIQSAFDEVRL